VAAVAGERKAVTSDPVPSERQQAASPKALILWTEKTFIGEQTGESSGAPDCDVQCREQQAGGNVANLER